MSAGRRTWVDAFDRVPVSYSAPVPPPGVAARRGRSLMSAVVAGLHRSVSAALRIFVANGRSHPAR